MLLTSWSSLELTEGKLANSCGKLVVPTAPSNEGEGKTIGEKQTLASSAVCVVAGVNCRGSGATKKGENSGVATGIEV